MLFSSDQEMQCLGIELFYNHCSIYHRTDNNPDFIPLTQVRFKLTLSREISTSFPWKWNSPIKMSKSIMKMSSSEFLKVIDKYDKGKYKEELGNR